MRTQRRRVRARLGLASVALGAVTAIAVDGLLLHPLAGTPQAPSVRLVAQPDTRASLIAAATLALAAWGTLPSRQRVQAGCGWCLGGALAGAGLAVLFDARALAAWDVALFGTGLLLVGAWLAAGAAPPRAARDLSRPGGLWIARRRRAPRAGALRKRGLKPA